MRKQGVKYIAVDVLQRKDQLDALVHSGAISSIPDLFIEGKLIASGWEAIQKVDLLSKIPADHIVESLESRLKRLVN
jgi:glutaredoxin-related protein